LSAFDVTGIRIGFWLDYIDILEQTPRHLIEALS
jgi:hypothetical protein